MLSNQNWVWHENDPVGIAVIDEVVGSSATMVATIEFFEFQ